MQSRDVLWWARPEAKPADRVIGEGTGEEYEVTERRPKVDEAAEKGFRLAGIDLLGGLAVGCNRGADDACSSLCGQFRSR